MLAYYFQKIMNNVNYGKLSPKTFLNVFISILKFTYYVITLTYYIIKLIDVTVILISVFLFQVRSTSNNLDM